MVRLFIKVFKKDKKNQKYEMVDPPVNIDLNSLSPDAQDLFAKVILACFDAEGNERTLKIENQNLKEQIEKLKLGNVQGSQFRDLIQLCANIYQFILENEEEYQDILKAENILEKFRKEFVEGKILTQEEANELHWLAEFSKKGLAYIKTMYEEDNSESDL